MRYRTLGTSGLRVSVVGVGCNTFGRELDLDGTRAVVDAAIEAGVTLFDTADVYGGTASESLLGEVLVGRRDQVVVATKFGNANHDLGYGPAAGAKGSRTYIRRAVEASLRRLRTDYIDLYQLHTPDPQTPIAETLAALDDLVREGKIRYLGHANFAGWQLAEAAHTAKELNLTPFVSAQNHWSLLDRGVETDLVPAAVHYGVGVLPYYPLSNGLLTGKVRRGAAIPADSRLAGRTAWITERRLDAVESLIAWAEKQGVSILDVAIGGLAALPGCASVIAGTTRPHQVISNAAAGDWQPTPEQLTELNAIVPIPEAP
jgi:aryl-alcohol dehydrogenase-like predicted oxidoreductase